MMEEAKLKEAFDACLEYLKDDDGNVPEPLRDEEGGPAKLDGNGELTDQGIQHLVFMCIEGKKFIDEIEALYIRAGDDPSEHDNLYDRAVSRREKAMRWLGFVQGALWMGFGIPISELKNMNKPNEEKQDGDAEEG